jgi:protein DEK
LPCLCYVHQEKQRNRIKEKLEKFNKEKLLDFCEVLDINVKVTTKKVSWLS